MSLLAIILKVILKTNIQELTIATYTINKTDFETLCYFVKNNRIKKLNLLVASSYVFRDKEYYDFLIRECLDLVKKYDVHLVFAWSHFKITLIQSGENYYHMEGSMNYSKNNMAENICFSNDKELYNFDYDFIIKTMAEQTNQSLQVIC
jgi:hypothetical protein